MTLCDDAMDGYIRGGVVVFLGGVVLDGVDRVLGNVVALQREILLHGGNGDVHFFVVVGVVAAADLLADADHGEIDSVNGNDLADHGMALKENLRGFLRDKDDAARLEDVLLIDKAACSDGKITDNRVAWLISAQMGRSVAPLTDLVEIGAGKLGRDVFNFRQAANGVLVAQGQLIGAHAGVLVGQGGDGAVHDHDDVMTELRKLLTLAFAEAFAKAHKDEQRANSPCNSKHGEEAAQLVSHDGAENLPESVREAVHDVWTARGRLCLSFNYEEYDEDSGVVPAKGEGRVRGNDILAPESLHWTRFWVIRGPVEP